MLWSPVTGYCTVEKDTLSGHGSESGVALLDMWLCVAWAVSLSSWVNMVTTLGHSEDDSCAELMCLLYSLFASASCFLVSVGFFISWLLRKKEKKSFSSSLFPYFHGGVHIVHLQFFLTPNIILQSKLEIKFCNSMVILEKTWIQH